MSDDDKKWLTGQLQEIRADIKRVEKNLLTEQHNRASLEEVRVRTRTAALHMMVVDLEYRVQKLENPGRPQ